MSKYCTQCGAECDDVANFCRKCGRSFRRGNLPARREPAQLSSFEGLRKLSSVVAEQQEWLRRNTLLEPLQEVINNVSLRSTMEEATERQQDQVLAGYDEYTHEQIEQVIDQVRHARRLGDADVALAIKEQTLDIEDEITEREHQRRLERLREEHKHEREVLQLRAQLELINAIIQSYNQLQMVQLQAQAEGLADVQQMKLLGEVISHSFSALAEIDTSLIEYDQRLKALDMEPADARSPELIEEVIEALIDRVTQGVREYGG